MEYVQLISRPQENGLDMLMWKATWKQIIKISAWSAKNKALLGRFPFKWDYLHAFVILVMRCDVHILFREAIQSWVANAHFKICLLWCKRPTVLYICVLPRQENSGKSEMLDFTINDSQMLLWQGYCLVFPLKYLGIPLKLHCILRGYKKGVSPFQKINDKLPFKDHVWTGPFEKYW